MDKKYIFIYFWRCVIGTTTSKLNLFKPDVDETDWGADVNNNFDILDDAIVTKLKTINIASSTYTVDIDDDVIGVDLSGESNFDIDLPQASTVEGLKLYIYIYQDGEGAAVTLDTYAGDQFYGHAGDISASTLGDSIILISDGNDAWYIFANNGFS